MTPFFFVHYFVSFFHLDASYYKDRFDFFSSCPVAFVFVAAARMTELDSLIDLTTRATKVLLSFSDNKKVFYPMYLYEARSIKYHWPSDSTLRKIVHITIIRITQRLPVQRYKNYTDLGLSTSRKQCQILDP